MGVKSKPASIGCQTNIKKKIYLSTSLEVFKCDLLWCYHIKNTGHRYYNYFYSTTQVNINLMYIAWKINIKILFISFHLFRVLQKWLYLRQITVKIGQSCVILQMSYCMTAEIRARTSVIIPADSIWWLLSLLHMQFFFRSDLKIFEILFIIPFRIFSTNLKNNYWSFKGWKWNYWRNTTFYWTTSCWKI